MNQVHWLQEQFDQAGTVRNYVKWEYELRTVENIHHVVRRAFQVAASEPSGPVYLAVPQDVMLEKTNKATLAPAKMTNVSNPGLDDRTLEEIASILRSAANPLILAGYSGRNVKSVDSLIDLAETIGARVVSTPVRMNFPTTHPLFSGFDSTPYISKADVILIFDQDVPYIPSRVRPQPEARIIHIDVDPGKENYPLWGFPADLLIRADSAKVLPALSERLRNSALPAQKALFRSRSEQIAAANQKMQGEWLSLAVSKSAQKPLAPDWVCHCLSEAIDENTLVLGEAVTNTAALIRQLKRSQPGSFFQSGGSNLGWGLGAALGAKLASPGKTVVTVGGDGGFIFGCPTAALWAAATFHIPFLSIVLNNMQYTAPKLTLKMALGAKSYAVQSGNWVGTEIKPSPDYAAIARACHAYAATVEDPSALVPAIKAALEQVRKGLPAVLEVKVDSSF
jgi:acetolactate synthase I/II/III large subunit